jgi:selenocysteine lyase/cysteine desulfurase
MDNRYSTLQTLYRIVKEEPHPEQYLCTPRELVLHSTFGWEIIHKHLMTLSGEGLVTLQQLDTPHCYITLKGIERVHELTHEMGTEEGMPGLLIKQSEIISE